MHFSIHAQAYSKIHIYRLDKSRILYEVKYKQILYLNFLIMIGLNINACIVCCKIYSLCGECYSKNMFINVIFAYLIIIFVSLMKSSLVY